MSKISLRFFLTAGIIIACFAFTSMLWAVGPADINWEKPVPSKERIMGQGPVVDEYPDEYQSPGVSLEGRSAMLTGYILPEGWEKATEGVKKIVATNGGGLKHDPATALNAKIFEKMTGIKVEIVEMKAPLLWPKTLAVVMAKSKDIDVFYSDRSVAEIPHLSAAGWVESVEDIWPEDTRKLFPKGMLGCVQGIDKKIYGTPVALLGWHLYYRPSWLKKAGVEVPQTWQELITASKKVDEWAKKNLGAGYTGMVDAAGDYDHVHMLWMMTTYTQNKTIMDKSNKVKIDKEAWNTLTDLWLKGGASKESIEYSWVDAPEVFAKGKAGFLIGQSVYMKNFNDPKFAEAIKDDWGVTLSPGWEGLGNRGAQGGGNDAWIINPFINANQKAAAMLWLDFYRSFQAGFNELITEGNESFIPAVYDHPFTKKNIEYPELRSAASMVSFVEPFVPGMSEVIDIFLEYFHKTIMGSIDQDKARLAAQEEIDQIM